MHIERGMHIDYVHVCGACCMCVCVRACVWPSFLPSVCLCLCVCACAFCSIGLMRDPMRKVGSLCVPMIAVAILIGALT